MSSRLQLDMRNLSLGRRHLVNAYEVKAGIGVIAGNTVWSMPERLECEVLQKVRYINTLTFTFTFTWNPGWFLILGLLLGGGQSFSFGAFPLPLAGYGPVITCAKFQTEIFVGYVQL